MASCSRLFRSELEIPNFSKQSNRSASFASPLSPLRSVDIRWKWAGVEEGVVFALSGFGNPERRSLHSQALDMGAEYRQDWTSDCTLLVSAFSNTPKFRQVESENGTIVLKEWILECHNERKLVEIEPYLMYAGKTWRKNSKQLETDQDQNQI